MNAFDHFVTRDAGLHGLPALCGRLPALRRRQAHAVALAAGHHRAAGRAAPDPPRSPGPGATRRPRASPFWALWSIPTHRLLKRRKGIAYRRRLRVHAGRLSAAASRIEQTSAVGAGLDQPRALRRHVGPAQGAAQGGAPVSDDRQRNAHLHQDLRLPGLAGAADQPLPAQPPPHASPGACWMPP